MARDGHKNFNGECLSRIIAKVFYGFSVDRALSGKNRVFISNMGI
jgi:hypothetical protein